MNPSSRAKPSGTAGPETRTAPRERVTFRSCPDVTWTDARGIHTRMLTGPFVIGSAPTADIRVADPLVSRLHAELSMNDGAPYVRDLGSRNGTFVAGVRVTGAYVPPEASLQVGSTHLTLTTQALPAAVEIWPEGEFFGLVGASLPMRELYAILAKVAATEATVLLSGETGTGKERVAEAIHKASPRAKAPFVVVDCGAVPEALFESEVFGHKKGSFTGAAFDHGGSFEAAHGGTVFLDEIAELPTSMQAKLLRALETRSLRRVGETGYRRFDARFIAATHRDLREMVNAGAFREDLYFRLAVLPVTLPPLRAHAEDIPALVARFVGGDPAAAGFDAPLLAEMASRPWLGNVRELRNFVERVRALGRQGAFGFSHGGPAPPDPSPVAGLPPLDTTEPFKVVRRRWVEHLERFYLTEMLKANDRSMTAVAQASGLDRAYVYRLVRKHGL